MELRVRRNARQVAKIGLASVVLCGRNVGNEKRQPKLPFLLDRIEQQPCHVVETLFLFDLRFAAQILHQRRDLLLLRLLTEFVFHLIKRRHLHCARVIHADNVETKW